MRAGNRLRNRLAPELREEKLGADFDRQKKQNHNDRGADDLASVFDGKTGAQIVTQNRSHGGDQANAQESIAGCQRGADAADVGSQIDHFRAACGAAGIQTGDADEDDHQEGAGTGAVIAVIAADDNGGDADNQQTGPIGAGFGLVGPAAAPQSHEGNDGQNHKQQIFQNDVRRMELQPRAADTAQHGQSRAGETQFPIHQPVFYEAGRG